jgi:hypothetical protein
MKFQKHTIAGLCTVLLLAGCVSRPSGPTVAVMPGPNKSFDAFRVDDMNCRAFADQTLGSGEQEANNRQVGTAVIGTLLGAGLGAAIGGGQGAAIGAGAGALGGTAVSSGPAQGAQYSLQQRYNISYSQCMYSKGNQVPGAAMPTAYSSPPPTTYQSPTITPSGAPQPPAGTTITPTVPQ